MIHLSEINKKCLGELNKIDVQTMDLCHSLQYYNINLYGKRTYINVLKVKLRKLSILYKGFIKTCTNPFGTLNYNLGKASFIILVLNMYFY